MNAVFLALFIISVTNAQQQSSTLFSSGIDVSEGCRTAVQRLSTLQATKPQLMARYWDSWGKPSDGILTGHTTFLGYYDECINLKNTDLGDMKYCIYPMVMGTIIMQRSLALKALDGLKIFSNFIIVILHVVSLSCFILRIFICNSFPHSFFFS